MRKSIFFLFILIPLSFIFSACTKEAVTPQTGVLYQSNFSQGQDGWTADIADYSPQTGDIRFESSWTSLPQPLDGNRKTFMVSSINRSDDLFMFLKRKVTGLTPNTDYKLAFDIELASQYATNSMGIGGSPGSSVFLKAGATIIEPVKTLVGDLYTLNIDKGNQMVGGKDAQVLGNIGAGDDVITYKLITRSNAENPLTVRSNAQGELWLIVGTDSGYEGQTTLYYDSIKVTLK